MDRAKKTFIGLLATTCALIPSTSSFAQSANDDVVIMRRVLAPPKKSFAPDPQPENPVDENETRPLPGSNLNSYYWVVSGWLSLPDDTCSTEAVQKRFRGCVLRGAPASPELCPSPAPEIERIAEEYKGCEYQWQTSPAGDWESSCSSRTTRQINSVCMRETGQIVDDNFCSGQKPLIETGFNFSGCTYEWVVGDFGNWDRNCSENTFRLREVACLRSDGEIVGDSSCPSPIPESRETGENYQGCTYSWQQGMWGASQSTCSEETTRTRENKCMRSDGIQVSNEFCNPSEEPIRQETISDLSGCGFQWITSEFGPWSETCSANAIRSREVLCQRSDNKIVEDNFCFDRKPDVVETGDISTSCTYQWQVGEWQQTNRCNANAVKTRDVQCLRSDLTIASDVYCTQEKPASTEFVADYSGCTFNWEPQSWGNWAEGCSDNTTRTRTAVCKRTDGKIVENDFCSQISSPILVEQGSNYSGCDKVWVTGQWSEYDSSCSSNATRTRTVGCNEIRPNDVVPIELNKCDEKTQPAQRETAEIYGGCENRWETGQWGWNGISGQYSSTCSSTAQQTRTLECKAVLQTGELVNVSDSSCLEEKPETIKISPQFGGCTYSWVIGDWSPFDSTCSDTATRRRTVECKRSDNTIVANSVCSMELNEAVPPQEEVGSNVTDCTGLLKNGGFEDGSQFWTMGSRSQIVNTGLAYAGTRSLVLTGSNASLTAVTQAVSTEPGRNYNITFYARTPRLNDLVVITANDNIIATNGPTRVRDENKWLFSSSTFTSNSSVTNISIMKASNHSSLTYVDEIVITEIK